VRLECVRVCGVRVCVYTCVCSVRLGCATEVLSFAEYSPFYRSLLQKRPVILRSL